MFKLVGKVLAGDEAVGDGVVSVFVSHAEEVIAGMYV